VFAISWVAVADFKNRICAAAKLVLAEGAATA
jgi:hypothetical protein